MANSVVFPRAQFFSNSGRPLVGGRIHTYVAGSSTRARTYQDAANVQINTNPIILDARGEAAIYLAEGVEYKFVVEDSTGALIMTQEPVYGAIWPNAAEWPSDATLAYQYMTEARAAASATGPIKFYGTKAQADAAIGTLANGDIIEISQDETRAGARTRYKVQAGALVFVVNLDQVRLDLAASSGASQVGYLPAGTGAVATDVQSKLRERYSLSDFYEPSEGAAAMHNALTRVCTEAPRQTVEIDIGDFDWTLNSDFVLPAAKRVLLHGHGSVNFAGGSIIRAHHDKHTVLHGFKATGAFPLFKFVAAPSGSAFREYEITSIEAAMNSGVWAVSLDGAREGVISNCYFRSGKGLYRTLSNICYIDKSHFLGLEHAVLDNGLGSPYSCATVMRDSEVLGCNRSIVISQCDDGEINGCTIDYNDEGIYLLGQDGFKIYGGYIGTRTAAAATPNVAIGGVTAALNILGDGAVASEKVSVIGAHFTGHHLTNLEYDNIYIENADHTTIADCALTFYTRNAVRHGSNVVQLDVHSNQCANRSGTASKVFECTGAGTVTNRFRDNTVNAGQTIAVGLGRVSGNIGYYTESSGQAFASAGATGFYFAHGLSAEPASGDISFYPMNLETAQKTPYLAGQSATHITINIDGVAAGTLSIGWAVRKRLGI